MVSYLNLLSDLFDAGRYTEKDLSGDVTHPSALGHAIVGEMLWKYLNQVYAELDSYGEPVKFDKKIFTKAKYLDVELAGVGDITPENLQQLENYKKQLKLSLMVMMESGEHIKEPGEDDEEIDWESLCP